MPYPVNVAIYDPATGDVKFYAPATGDVQFYGLNRADYVDNRAPVGTIDENDNGPNFDDPLALT